MTRRSFLSETYAFIAIKRNKLYDVISNQSFDIRIKISFAYIKAVFNAKFIYFIGVSRHSTATVIRADWLKRMSVIKNQGQDWLTSCHRFSVCV